MPKVPLYLRTLGDRLESAYNSANVSAYANLYETHALVLARTAERCGDAGDTRGVLERTVRVGGRLRARIRALHWVDDVAFVLMDEHIRDARGPDDRPFCATSQSVKVLRRADGDGWKIAIDCALEFDLP